MKSLLLANRWQAGRIRKHGQSLAEYGLILALITIVCIGIMTAMGDHFKRFFTDVSNSMPEVRTH